MHKNSPRVLSRKQVLCHKIASSVFVEYDFKQLKTLILRFNVRPIAVDEFIVTHLKSIDSYTKLFLSNRLRNV